MEIINLTKEEFSHLEEYKLPENLFVAESKLYIYKDLTSTKLIKKFNTPNEPGFENKIYTIKLLLKYHKMINIEELVFPEKLVQIDKQVIGFTMELIPSINLDEALLSEEISIERKINYLYQIGVILSKVNGVRKQRELSNFYLVDIHEGNFIIDLTKNQVRVIDINSCKIKDNKAYTFTSKYLQPNPILSNTDKYQEDRLFPYAMNLIPTKDTELYCYIMIILNFLYGEGIEKLEVQELSKYLDYLENLGINSELINIFRKVYTDEPNENPYNLLKDLIPYYGLTNKEIYQKSKKR